MQLQPVNDKLSQKAFFDVPYRIYENEPNWIPPLQRDLDFIFNQQKNPAFRENELQRWVLRSHDGNLIGRVAAFTKSDAIKNEPYRIGGIGFFECIHDQQAASMLFDKAREWLEERGVKAMDGPINFGQRDKFWGLLVEGFKQPNYQENYNPPYYQELFEAYGFEKHFDQETFEVIRGDIDLEWLQKIAERATSKTTTTVKTLELDKLDQFVADFLAVYNRAWEEFQHFKPLTHQEVKSLFKQVKPILEKDFLIFVYVDGHPAGIIFLLPDVNQIFKYFNGKLGIWEQLKFLWYRKRGMLDKLKGLVFGIHPDFQNRGVDALLIYHLVKKVEENGKYRSAELSWIGDFNPKMKATIRKLNARRSKLHITYRKLFDEKMASDD